MDQPTTTVAERDAAEQDAVATLSALAPPAGYARNTALSEVLDTLAGKATE